MTEEQIETARKGKEKKKKRKAGGLRDDTKCRDLENSR